MSLDTASQPSTASLSVRDAAALFSGEPEPKPEPAAKPAETPEVEAVAPPEDTQADPDTETVDEAPAEPEKVTIEVDGKTVELTKAELAEHYKNGLRQADYTRKTMEAAEQRKAADAEASKAREERQKYSQGLQQAQAVLQAQINQQSQIDWHQLRETDPPEFLKQWHLFSERQANLQRVVGEQQQLNARAEAEQAEQIKTFVREQQEQLLAKLPEWKDAAKAKAGQAELVNWLKTNEYPPELFSLVDRSSHLIVGLRKAMLYDQMMSKASAAAKKVENLPQKVARPGGGEVNPTDGRTADMKRLQKSGSVRDAARLLEKMF